MRSCFHNGANWLGKDMFGWMKNFGGEVSTVVSGVGEAVDALMMKRPQLIASLKNYDDLVFFIYFLITQSDSLISNFLSQVLSFLYWVLSSRLAGSSQYLYNFVGIRKVLIFFLSCVLTLKLHPIF